MIARSLLFFRSPVPKPPSFVIPVFSQPGTNDVCVQDLNAAGLIKGFLPFHSDDFYAVNILAPRDFRTAGQHGLLAFWMSESELIVGTTGELRSQLADVDQESLSPFAAVELTMLVGNSEMMDKAADRAAKLIRSEKGRLTYKQRVNGRYRILVEAKREAVQPDTEDHSINDVLALLQTQLEPEVWVQEWSLAMDRFKNDDALISIAEWRLVEPKVENLEARIVSRVLGVRHPRSQTITYNWLESRAPDWPGYSSVWISLSRRTRDQFPNLNNLGYNYLRNYFLDIPKGNLHSWSIVWSRLWIGKYDEEALTQIAAKASELMMSPNDTFVEHVLMPLSRRTKHPHWVVEGILQWLRIPRAVRIWVENFVRFGDLMELDVRDEVAHNWLHNLGYGMNMWREVWQKTNSSRSVETQIGLGVRWLYRARKDLQSWPHVFRDVLELANNHPSNDMIRSARLWVGFYEHRKSDKVIEDVAKLKLADQETFELFPE